MKTKHIVVAAYIAYAIIGLLTFGWSVNHSVKDCGLEPEPSARFWENYEWTKCTMNNEGPNLYAPAMLTGIFWPVIFAGKISIAITDF